MKNYYTKSLLPILLAISLLIPNLVFSVPQDNVDTKLTKEQFKKIGPYIVCKLTYAYMLDAPSAKKWGQLSPCETKGANDFFELIKTYRESDSLLKQAEEFLSVTTHCWSGKGLNFFNAYKKIYDNALITGSYGLAQFKNPSQETDTANYHMTIKELKIEYPKLSIVSQKQTNKESDKQDDLSAKYQTDSTKNTDTIRKFKRIKPEHSESLGENTSLLKKIFSFWHWFVIAALILIIIFLIKSKLAITKKEQFHLDNIKQLEKRNRGLLNNQNAAATVEQLMRELQALKDRYNRLDLENKELRDNLDNAKLNKQYPTNQNRRSTEAINTPSPDYSINTQNQYTHQQQNQTAAPSSLKQAFLPFPYEDIKINAADQTDSATKDTFFRIDIESNGRKARISIYPNKDLLQMAFNSFEAIIKPVCKYNREPRSGQYNIKTINPGIAELQGDDWRVTDKIQVEFS